MWKKGEQITDLFTKVLNENSVEYLCNKLGIINTYSPTWEGVLWYISLEVITLKVVSLEN